MLEILGREILYRGDARKMQIEMPNTLSSQEKKLSYNT